MDRHVRNIVETYKFDSVKYVIEWIKECHRLDFDVVCKVKMRRGHLYAVSEHGTRMVLMHRPYDMILFSKILNK